MLTNLKSSWQGAQQLNADAQSNKCCHCTVRNCWRELDYNLILTILHLYTITAHTYNLHLLSVCTANNNAEVL